MNRNTESHFALLPNVNIGRSKFDRSSSVKFSFNTGELIPFYVDEVLPGDTFQIDTSKVVRMQTMLSAPMDNMYLDTYYFFVPSRLVWTHWKELMGENTDSAWIPQNSYTVPQITSPASTGWDVGTIADYMGIPTGIAGLSVNALPIRAYALVVDQWFRDQNLQDPLNISLGDSTVAGVNTGTFVTDIAKGGKPFIVAKYHDYFTSALPAPQKGPAVTIGATGNLPVVPSSVNNDFSLFERDSKKGYAVPMFGQPHNRATFDASAGGCISTNYTDGESAWPGNADYLNNNTLMWDKLGTYQSFVPTNLVALTGTSAAISINELREAFQLQKMLETDARSGSRYIEVIKAHFGVTSPDARLQRSEYLGGNRIPINVNQVVQNNGTVSGSTPQGNVAGYSLTSDTHSDFTRSFTEHGFVLGLCCVRYDHTYQQGIERMWSRLDRYDYYWPTLAHLGEQEILNKEIYADGTSTDNEVFGYQERYAEYRYKPNRVAGEMRSSYATSLDVWHLGDDYASLPQLSDAWIREDKTNVDRVLAVQSSTSNQLFADFYIRNFSTRPMPVYSVPGLIDHF